MAATWVRGRRCGINNCSSHFYQVSGGHRVCQNGHIQDGFEAAADDDEFAAIGRRINLPRQAPPAPEKTVASRIVHGREAFDLALGLMQDVLRAQVKWLRQKMALNIKFEEHVHRLWGGYLMLLLKPGSKVTSIPLTLRDLVVLCYLGLRIVQAPVLLIDILRWIALADFPYMYSHRWLDHDRFDRVPLEMRRVFTGLTSPTKLSLHHRVLVLRPHLERVLSIRIPPVDKHYSLLRLCRELMLPPEMYVGAKSLLIFDAKLPKRKVWISEELPHLCALVVATKMAYGLDGQKRVLPTTRKGEQIDWEVWRDVVRKTWILQPDPTVADERLAIHWDNGDIDKYLAWQRQTILPPDNANDRLLSMFTLGDEVSKYETVDEDTLTELCHVVHSTSAPYEEVSDEPGSTNGPGTQYQIYSSRKEFQSPLPDITCALFDAIGAIWNISENDVRHIVRGFEIWVRKRYGKLAFFDVPQHRASHDSIEQTAQ